MSYVRRKAAEKILKNEGRKAFYIISDVDVIEEGVARWVRIEKEGDGIRFYPTINIVIGESIWKAKKILSDGIGLTADFDTGSPHVLVVDSRITERFVPAASVNNIERAIHLGKWFDFMVASLSIVIRDDKNSRKFRTFQEYSLCVLSWDKSPFVNINPNRRALVGMSILDYGINITLRGNDKTTVVHLA